MELMQAVPWKRTVVLMKKAQTSICGPLVPRPGAYGLKEGAGAESGEREENRDDEVEAVEPHELGEFREVLDLGVVGREIAAGRDPADMGPEEAVDVGRMGVLRIVGVEVMVAMMVGPPERAALDGRRGPQREEELADAGRAVGLVGEVAVVDAGDGKHADEVECDGGPDGDGAPADPDHGEARRWRTTKGMTRTRSTLSGSLRIFCAVGTII